MAALFSPTIAAVLLIHAVLGCCWQHARQAIAEAATNISVADTCCHQHDAPEHSAPQQPCDCRWECHATCVYLADKPTFEMQSLVAAFAGDLGLFAVPAPVDWATVGSRASRARAHESAALGARPPLRLHLLHQLLLI
ncbi:MAG: hypothetical protein JNG90_02135 [Planctomycetaceae bacterium]|nr:hypothetical protein [Planctomycetaceae bacterium]